MSTTVKTPTDTLKEGFRYVRKSDRAILVGLEDNLNEAVEKLNAVINGDSIPAIHTAQEAADAALDNYNKTATLCAYEDFLETEDPMKSALIAGYITVKKLVTVDVFGTKVVSAEDNEVQIDFIALHGIGGRLMGAQTPTIAAQMSYMVLLAKAEADGKSVDAVNAAFRGKPLMKVYEQAPSKNDLKEVLQSLINQVYYEDNGSGKNRFMVTSGWCNWFCDAINTCRYGKGSLSRSSKSVKQIIQTVCGMYHAYFNKYGVRTVVDKDTFVVADAESPAPVEAAAEPAKSKKVGKKSK